MLRIKDKSLENITVVRFGKQPVSFPIACFFSGNGVTEEEFAAALNMSRQVAPPGARAPFAPHKMSRAHDKSGKTWDLSASKWPGGVVIYRISKQFTRKNRFLG